jgi:hypothetical protein
MVPPGLTPNLEIDPTVIIKTSEVVVPSNLNFMKMSALKKKAKKAIPDRGREGCHIFPQMAVRFSALHTGRPLPPRNIPGTHFC